MEEWAAALFLEAVAIDGKIVVTGKPAKYRRSTVVLESDLAYDLDNLISVSLVEAPAGVIAEGSPRLLRSIERLQAVLQEPPPRSCEQRFLSDWAEQDRRLTQVHREVVDVALTGQMSSQELIEVLRGWRIPLVVHGDLSSQYSLDCRLNSVSKVVACLTLAESGVPLHLRSGTWVWGEAATSRDERLDYVESNWPGFSHRYFAPADWGIPLEYDELTRLDVEQSFQGRGLNPYLANRQPVDLRLNHATLDEVARALRKELPELNIVVAGSAARSSTTPARKSEDSPRFTAEIHAPDLRTALSALGVPADFRMGVVRIGVPEPPTRYIPSRLLKVASRVEREFFCQLFFPADIHSDWLDNDTGFPAQQWHDLIQRSVASKPGDAIRSLVTVDGGQQETLVLPEPRAYNVADLDVESRLVELVSRLPLSLQAWQQEGLMAVVTTPREHDRVQQFLNNLRGPKRQTAPVAETVWPAVVKWKGIAWNCDPELIADLFDDSWEPTETVWETLGAQRLDISDWPLEFRADVQYEGADQNDFDGSAAGFFNGRVFRHALLPIDGPIKRAETVRLYELAKCALRDEPLPADKNPSISLRCEGAASDVFQRIAAAAKTPIWVLRRDEEAFQSVSTGSISPREFRDAPLNFVMSELAGALGLQAYRTESGFQLASSLYHDKLASVSIGAYDVAELLGEGMSRASLVRAVEQHGRDFNPYYNPFGDVRIAAGVAETTLLVRIGPRLRAIVNNLLAGLSHPDAAWRTIVPFADDPLWYSRATSLVDPLACLLAIELVPEATDHIRRSEVREELVAWASDKDPEGYRLKLLLRLMLAAPAPTKLDVQLLLNLEQATADQAAIRLAKAVGVQALPLILSANRDWDDSFMYMESVHDWIEEGTWTIADAELYRLFVLWCLRHGSRGHTRHFEVIQEHAAQFSFNKVVSELLKTHPELAEDVRFLRERLDLP